MNSAPTFDEVRTDLGDKVVSALSSAVDMARDDLATYRSRLPQFVAEQSERGLANWIHDRMWANLSTLVDGLGADISLTEHGVVREIGVGINYLLRLKRHDEDGAIATFPTQGALDFYAQAVAEPALDGMERITLAAGYRWIPDERQIGAAVLSLRDGLDHVIWCEEISSAGAGGLPVLSPAPDAPTKPTIELVGDASGSASEADN